MIKNVKIINRVHTRKCYHLDYKILNICRSNIPNKAEVNKNYSVCIAIAYIYLPGYTPLYLEGLMLLIVAQAT